MMAVVVSSNANSKGHAVLHVVVGKDEHIRRFRAAGFNQIETNLDRGEVLHPNRGADQDEDGNCKLSGTAAL